MPFAAAMSQHPLATHAVGEVVGEVLDQLGERPDAAVVFVTGPFAGAMEDIAAAVRAMLEPGSLVGTSAASVLAGDREVEGTAAISLFAMRFGPPRRFADEPLVRTIRFDDSTSVEADLAGTLVLLADPFSFPVEGFLDDLTRRSRQLTVVGGLASAANGPGGNRLVADHAVFDDGAVGLVLPPGVGVTAVVSQGCRPVGEPLVVTRSTGNLIEEIAGRPALDRLLGQAEAATPEDRSRMARSLQLGVAVDERKVDFDRSDFLIRTVLGADHARRAVAVGADVEVGSTVQFHVRDATTADEDLRDLLADARGDAALVFTCTGRGTALFPSPHHDATVLHQHLDGGAVAGMFSAGEIGPIGNRHFVHAMSASALLLDDLV
ncbi:FIST N-terminal domain-containing protein [Aquihabitans daechungensis]|uniref:FIST signal transduction protein n=1 Tax=Aquihabitans daechungensis TaxID=1052257 RepID=UPI003BA27345